MKLIIQIPAYNESATIAEVLEHIPRSIAGVDRVEVLVIDDGSTDGTADIARQHGADYIVRHVGNKGLAAAFQTGINAALRLGADIIVNTDADHQYPGDEIPRIVAPIVRGEAEYVIGDRQVQTIEHFSPIKKALQHIGSSVVRWASGTDVPDTVSGFRALSREAALRMFVTTDFSYTVENIIQAGKKGLTIATVPIRTNPTRPSKLFRGNWNFVKRQAATIVRTYATYEPLKTFSYIATALLVPGLILLLWAGYIFIGRRLNIVTGSNDQSLLVGGVLVMLSLITFLIGLLSDRIGGMRRVLDENLYRQRKQEIELEDWRRVVTSRLEQVETAIDHVDQIEALQSSLLGRIERLESALERSTAQSEAWQHQASQQLAQIADMLQRLAAESHPRER